MDRGASQQKEKKYIEKGVIRENMPNAQASYIRSRFLLIKSYNLGLNSRVVGQRLDEHRRFVYAKQQVFG